MEDKKILITLYIFKIKIRDLHGPLEDWTEGIFDSMYHFREIHSFVKLNSDLRLFAIFAEGRSRARC